MLPPGLCYIKDVIIPIAPQELSSMMIFCTTSSNFRQWTTILLNDAANLLSCSFLFTLLYIYWTP